MPNSPVPTMTKSEMAKELEHIDKIPCHLCGRPQTAICGEPDCPRDPAPCADETGSSGKCLRCDRNPGEACRKTEF